jgi:hypothetical protein
LRFDGDTFEPVHDEVRLTGQTLAVWRVLLDGRWHTIDEICQATGYKSQASVSARLRDFRKERFGGHDVERRRRGDPSEGLHEYRIARDEPEQAVLEGVTMRPGRRW